MKKIVLVLGVSIGIAGFGSAVSAQTAPPAAPDLTKGIMDEGADTAKEAMMPKAKMAKPAKKMKMPASVTLKITNARTVSVTALTIGLSGSGTGKNAVVKPLAAGKSTSIKLDTKKGCTFDIRGAFEDDAAIEADAVDFCADNTLVLKE